jgi:hypothetical protein
MGAVAAPAKQIDRFEAAGRGAIDAFYGQRLEADLNDFIAHHASDAELAGSWSGVKADQIVAGLRREIEGAQVTTFGGVTGAYFSVFYGTIARERVDEDAPIELNRWALGHRTAPQLANTIAHEIAHAIGLRHPHMGGPAPKDWAIAPCEPPYLIGSLVERIAAGAAWQWTSDHCVHLRPSQTSPAAR